ncbi:flagellar assembly protein FliW [Paramaledivibacter caminithermalis]|jgi:flagellar assembly factor FliW|uniref:Flagellar assembly factor FliW n=1 Tax=Paramaledivibacter caminithermalis (strain DSM 15212 / CIP 107654 / DViRD3) TaxID=1121301 RepID=A0A1M6L5P5_PARC5|nr:flagellar assembly protein FliW [Paramaledivibacter caminithermalis]SHJ66531.1 flagellar assembly factor FliW [Paramaledivibacter caminithermalis DSM 15212]
MKIKTKYFGEIEINEDGIITFEDGIPGFGYVKKYVMLKNPNPELPFNWLQGVDEPSLAFVIVNPFLFKEDYEFDIPQSTIEELCIENIQDVLICSIVTIPQEMINTTMNLKAPIIINTKTKKGKQLVLDTDKYEIKYKIFKKTAL